MKKTCQIPKCQIVPSCRIGNTRIEVENYYYDVRNPTISLEDHINPILRRNYSSRMARNEKVEINMENGFTTMVHEMKMDGHHLVESKHRISVDCGLYGHITTQLIHSRSVDDISYTVSESLLEGNHVVTTQMTQNDEPVRGVRVVATRMTQEEVEKFEEDWINLWKPEIDTTFFD